MLKQHNRPRRGCNRRWVRDKRTLNTRLQPTLAMRRQSVSEVFEVCCYAEVAAAHELNDSLQVVLLFSGDANLPILQLALDLEPLRFDRLDNFFGFVSFEALLDLQFLPGMADG